MTSCSDIDHAGRCRYCSAADVHGSNIRILVGSSVRRFGHDLRRVPHLYQPQGNRRSASKTESLRGHCIRSILRVHCSRSLANRHWRELYYSKPASYRRA